MAVADVIESMMFHRPYRESLGLEVALKEISVNRGRLYDPIVVDTCLKLFREKGFHFDSGDQKYDEDFFFNFLDR